MEEHTEMTIDIPFKIGDTAWCIRRFHQKKIPQPGIVSEMYFNADMELVVAVKYVGRGAYGKDVFASKVDAENFLKSQQAVYW